MIIRRLLKTIPTARGAQSLQRMDSACLFLLFKLLGKVFRTMTITKGLWGRATLTMDQKFEIGTPLMRNFLEKRESSTTSRKLSSNLIELTIFETEEMTGRKSSHYNAHTDTASNTLAQHPFELLWLSLALLESC